MFSKILIANRGEIACRVARTARRMGIGVVAVYSDADADAPHVDAADEAVRIGEPPAARSYLRGDAIVEACRATGAEAVHPGYGFLSENAGFAAALEAAGIAFIGPGPEAIEAMGDKIAAKRLAAEAGVSTIPGVDGAVDSAGAAVAAAAEVGYPVMLKAAAGGGGKGMRIARGDGECRDGFERAASEARSSFGDGRVFVEKYIERPRHIEIQLLADAHGNVVYLGERECSLQRRHQKVIEEAPSPFIGPEQRRAMGEQAVALARAVGYRSAGTVEFIVDASGGFYFLEMNTRLQVEHPVTEYVTGLDLVEWMIRVAAGEALDFGQEDVALRGWAIEARVYAEDPTRGFLPSVGRLTRFRPPGEESAGVRLDTGVAEGTEVSIYYDPMIAKLTVHADSRALAIARLAQALDRFAIEGVVHNVPFLQALLALDAMASGDIHTHLIAEEFPQGLGARETSARETALTVVVAAVLHRSVSERAEQISGRMRAPRSDPESHWVVCIGTERHPVWVTRIEHGFEVEYHTGIYRVATDWHIGEFLFEAQVNGEEVVFQVALEGPGYVLARRGHRILAMVLEPRAAELGRHMIEKTPPDLSGYLLSPMPGLLVRFSVSVGQQVKAGEELAVVEAMKMENVLRAERDAVVAKLLVEEGQQLAVDQPIMELD